MARILAIVLGALVALGVCGHARLVSYVAPEPDCGMFVCSAQIDVTDISEVPALNAVCGAYDLETGPFPIPNSIMILCFPGVDY